MPPAMPLGNLTTWHSKSFSGMQAFFSEGVGRRRSFAYFSFAAERKVWDYRYATLPANLYIISPNDGFIFLMQ